MKHLATLMVALRGIFAHKLRSFLTVLGVIIGIGSIISMMAVGEGSEKSILGDLADLGSDAMWIEPGAGMMGRIAGAPGSTRNLTYNDYLAMKDSLDELTAVNDCTAQVSTRLQVDRQTVSAIPFMPVCPKISSARLSLREKFSLISTGAVLWLMPISPISGVSVVFMIK